MIAYHSVRKFVFKSSEKSPLGSLALGELVVEAGFPPGVINIISGAGKTGQLLAAHMGVRAISFTGSGPTGRKIQEYAAKSNLKRVTLELGGKSPLLIFDDADTEVALAQYVTLTSCPCILAQPAVLELTLYSRASQGFLVNSGQICAGMQSNLL